MLLILVLLQLILMCPYTFASEINLKEVVKQMEEASRREKEEVNQLVNRMKENGDHLTHVNDVNVPQGSCPVAGCGDLHDSSKNKQKQSPLLDANKPLIFVSASMPIESLKRLAYQARQQGAILVIRGMMNGSMIETAKLVDQIDYPFEIDPKLFEQFEIKKVPVFLIKHHETWHKVAGNVELNFALDRAKKQKENNE